MRPEGTPLGGSFRAAALAISLLTIVTLSTVAYSAYADVGQVQGSLSSGVRSSFVQVRAALHGTTLNVQINITVRNEGLYPVSISLSCVNPSAINSTCSSPSESIQPGKTGKLEFSITVNDIRSVSLVSGLNLEGRADLALVPFASVSATVNLGSLIRAGIE